MLTLGTVWEGNEYGPEAVAILFDMISRNLPEGTEGKFFCFTDHTADLGPWIEKRPLDGARDGTIMFPLGCAVIRGLDDLLEGKQIQSSLYDGSFPTDSAVVIFNECRPQDCGGWVKHVWRIGGGTTPKLTFLRNVPKEDIQANIRYAMGLGCKWFSPAPVHDRAALIVGGAPSLRDSVVLLRHMAISMDADIFALNGAASYLHAQGMAPDFHVMLDAHPDCIRFVSPHIPMTRYYASQCDSIVLDEARDSLVCWHGGGEAMNDLRGEFAFRHIVGGGSTGLTRAMVLAFGLGYRQIHVFGADSSYDGETGHAYSQADYDNFINVACGDEVFKTSPQLLGQAEDFKIIAPDLIHAGCEIMVHGAGLLTAVASQMAA